MNTNLIAERVLAAFHALPRADKMLITIDGPCGSGKSTLADRLAHQLNCSCAHMDDFYIPHAQKTPERLANPGGNADADRVMDELLLPWLSAGHAAYRPYDCAKDMLAEPVSVCGRVLILEGSYCNLPLIAKHASLRVYLTIEAEEQLRRLSERCNETRLAMFIQRWIPLEKSYAKAYSLPDSDCLVLSAD